MRESPVISSLLIHGVPFLALGAMIGCAERQPNAVERFQIAEGSRITGVAVQSASLAAGAGGTHQLGQWSFSARVEDGRARVVQKESGQLRLAVSVAVVEGQRPVPPQVRTFIDDEGHEHQLVLTGVAPGGPLALVQHSLDGQMLLEVEYQWNRIEGGWLLSERTLTVYRSRGPSLRHTVHVTRDVLAARGLPAAMQDGARALMRRVTPGVLHAQELKGCVSEYTVYGVATTGVVAAEVAVVLMPWNPLAWVALTGTIALWEQALDDLVRCMYRLDEDGEIKP